MLYIGENKGSHHRRFLLYSVGVLYVLSNHNKQLKKKMNCKLFRTHLNLNIKHKVLPEFCVGSVRVSLLLLLGLSAVADR